MNRAIWLAAAAAVLLAAVFFLRGPDAGDDSSGRRQIAAVAAATPPAGWPMQRSAPARTSVSTAHSAPPPSPAAGGQVERRAFGALHEQGSDLALAIRAPNFTRDWLDRQVAAFASELSVAQPRAKTPPEVRMVALYADALAAYRDALEFWELQRFTDRPGEDGSLDALAAKYGIAPGNRLSYTAEWRGYPNAFATIWAVGSARAAEAGALYDQ